MEGGLPRGRGRAGRGRRRTAAAGRVPTRTSSTTACSEISARRSSSTVSVTSRDAVGTPATTTMPMSPATSRSSTASLSPTKMSQSMPGCCWAKRARSGGSRWVPTVVEPPTRGRPEAGPLTCWTAATSSWARRKTRLPYSASTSPSAGSGCPTGRSEWPSRTFPDGVPGGRRRPSRRLRPSGVDPRMTEPLAVNGRRYPRPRRPVVVVCVDGSEDAYHERAITDGRMPFLERMLTAGAEVMMNDPGLLRAPTLFAKECRRQGRQRGRCTPGSAGPPPGLPLRPAAVPAPRGVQHRAGPDHLTPGLRQELALLTGDRSGELVGPRGERPARLRQIRGSFDRARGPPGPAVPPRRRRPRGRHRHRPVPRNPRSHRRNPPD